METGQGYGMGIGGCNELCPTAMGLSLVTLFFLSVLIEDRPLMWMVVRSQTYYPKHILTYGSRKAHTLLSWVLALSGPTNWKRGKVEV